MDDAARRGHRARDLRPSPGHRLLRRGDAGCARARGSAGSLSRPLDAGQCLVGIVRSRGQPLFRPSGRTVVAGLHHAQRGERAADRGRLVARRRSLPPRRLLRVRLPAAGGVRATERSRPRAPAGRRHSASTSSTGTTSGPAKTRTGPPRLRPLGRSHTRAWSAAGTRHSPPVRKATRHRLPDDRTTGGQGSHCGPTAHVELGGASRERDPHQHRLRRPREHGREHGGAAPRRGLSGLGLAAKPRTRPAPDRARAPVARDAPRGRGGSRGRRHLPSRRCGARRGRDGRRRDPGRARRGPDLDRHEHRQPAEEHGARVRVRAKDAWMLDAPVSGKRPAGAGRDADDHGRRRRSRLRRVEPLLRELGTPELHRRQRAGPRSSSSRSTSASRCRCSRSQKGCSWPSGRASTANVRSTSWRRARSARRCCERAPRSSSTRPRRRGSTCASCTRTSSSRSTRREGSGSRSRPPRAPTKCSSRQSLWLRAARPRRPVPGARRHRGRRPVARMATCVRTARHHRDALAARGGEGGWAAAPPDRADDRHRRRRRARLPEAGPRLRRQHDRQRRLPRLRRRRGRRSLGAWIAARARLLPVRRHCGRATRGPPR